MPDMRAYCGEDCAQCPIFIGTVTNDQKLREETARQSSKEHGVEIKPEDLHCLGCKSTQPLALSAPRCPVRKCNIEKKLDHCGACADFPCEPYNLMFKQDSAGRKFLDDFRASRRDPCFTSSAG